MKFNFINIKNEVYNPALKSFSTKIDIPLKTSEETSSDLRDLLRAHKKDIVEKKFGDISSFNFSRDVFKKRSWNELSKIARGLFINTSTGEIVARGFDKFFNYKEGQFNSDAFLKENLQFPVTAYKKYNGFLGILTFDKEQKRLLFCTKSCVDGTYSQYFKDIFNTMKASETDAYFEKLALHLAENDVCFVFEVIDPVNDPHIVKYTEPKLVLLAEIKLGAKFSQASYEDLCKSAKEFGFDVKEKVAEIKDFEELKSFISKSEDFNTVQGEEGWVLEDMAGYHFKLKCAWYKFWKSLREFKTKLQAGHFVSTSGLTTPLANRVYGFMKSKGRDWLLERSIVDVRDEFEKEYENEQ